MEKYIEENYINKTNAEMAEHLGCSVITVIRRLRKLGLSRQNIRYFVDKAKQVHGDRYDYSKSEYVNARTDILITCPRHGDFTIKPPKHLMGQKCYKCSKEDCSKELSKGLSGFIDDAIRIHGNKYDYSLVVYKNQDSRIKIICPQHGVFEQRAKNHLLGNACRKCYLEISGGWTTADWKKKVVGGKTLKLYYLQCWNNEEQFYKIGLTCKDRVEDRFHGVLKMPYEYRIINQVTGSIENLVKLERKFKKQIIDMGDKYLPKISFVGSTYECFKGKFIPNFEEVK